MPFKYMTQLEHTRVRIIFIPVSATNARVQVTKHYPIKKNYPLDNLSGYLTRESAAKLFAVIILTMLNYDLLFTKFSSTTRHK